LKLWFNRKCHSLKLEVADRVTWNDFLGKCCNTKLSRTVSHNLFSLETLPSSALNMETICFSERFFSMHESTWRHNPKEQTSLSSPAPLYWSVRNYYIKPVSCNLSPLSVTDLTFQSILLFLIRNYMGIIFAAGSMSLNKLLKCIKSLSTHENAEILYQVMTSFQFSLSFFLWMLTKWITSFIQISFYHQLKRQSPVYSKPVDKKSKVD